MTKTVLVTGGSHNIGQGIAVVLAEKGYDVAITYRSRPEGAEETRRAVEALGRRCVVIRAELSEADAPQRVVDEAYEALGGLDLAVCNAANPGGRGSLLTATAEYIDGLYASNFRNYVLTAGAAARYMVRDGVKGGILFVTSSRAQRAYPDDYLYGGFKAGIERACQSMALDLSAYGIRVNCVAPGCIWPGHGIPEDREEHEFLREGVPLHRSGTAREVGEAVAYLASDAAGYVTGISLRVDGGLILPGMREGAEPNALWYNPQWREDTYKEAMEQLRAHEQERKAST